MLKSGFIALAAVLAGVSANQLSVTIYNHGDCTEPSQVIQPLVDGYKQNQCYNYVWEGSNSAQITYCYGSSCACTFYGNSDCSGQSVRLRTNQCASHGGGWQSYKCSSLG
ncbi:hypothetical protein NQ176_g3801 [Zarea fungicola]|uniref:Uncharacterized protein n=1 Tax=Zarea fungicola TaxID=93591 RepID=A0ACC1NGK9_9HYPO|nr:hypothetical protein NQ176_g3801 [Lecanicillium fungicola]